MVSLQIPRFLVTMKCLASLKPFCLQNPKNITISYVNINAICTKFGSLFSLVSSHTDILSIAETILDYSFPNAQFLMPNFYQSFHMDISRNVEDY